MIPSAVIAFIETGFDAMATPTYNFNHGPVDVADPAHYVYPQSFFEFPEANPQGGPDVVGKHTFLWPFTFRGLLAPGAGSIEDEVDKYVGDCIKFMFSNLDAMQALGLLRYEAAGYTRRLRNIAAAPIEVRVNFIFVIRQSRANPSST